MGFNERKYRYAITEPRTIRGYEIAESLYPAGLKQARHNHSHAALSLVGAGSYLESIGRMTSSRRPATLIIHPPGEAHAVHFDSRARVLSVLFSYEKVAEIDNQCKILNSPSSCRSESVAQLGFRLGAELTRTDDAAYLAIEGIILELLAESLRVQDSGNHTGIPSWLRVAKEYIHDNFSESIALRDVCEVTGVHSVHLARTFRKNVGCTVGHYVRRLRVEQACRQLATTNKSLSEIAAAAGFSDQSHFNRVFKNFFDVTPNQYRHISKQGWRATKGILDAKLNI